MKPAKTPARPAPASPSVVTRADPVAGPAAQARPGAESPSNGGDWMAEAMQTPEAKPSDGVPLDTRPRGDTHRGQAKESRRGQRT